MQPTQSGGVLGDLSRLVKSTPTVVPPRSWWHDLHWYRRAAVELAIIVAVVITVVLYGIAVAWFARWAL